MVEPTPTPATAAAPADLGAIALAAADFVWMIDAADQVTYLSPGFTALTGHAVEAFVGHRPIDLPWVHMAPEARRQRLMVREARAPLRDGRMVVRDTAGRMRLLSLSGRPCHDAAGQFTGYAGIGIDCTATTEAESVLVQIADSVGHHTGDRYFRNLVRVLAETLGVDIAFIGRLLPDRLDRMGTVEAYGDGQPLPAFEYDLAGTPCAGTVDNEVCAYASGVAARFPDDPALADLGIEGYCGAPLFGAAGERIGVLVVMHRRPLANLDLVRRALTSFSGRAGAELERLIVDNKLRHSQQLLLQSQRLGRIGYILSDIRNDRVYWSDMVFELRRVAPRPYLSFAETMAFVHPDDRAGYMVARDAAIAARRPFEFDSRIVCPDGSIVWERCIGNPRFDDQGAFVGVLIVLQDVTARKQAEIALREREREMRAVLDNAPIAIYLKDIAGRYRLVNRCFEEWYRLPAAQVYGKTAADVFPPASARMIAESDREAITQRKVHQFDTRTTSAIPGVDHVLLTKFPIVDDDGEVVGIAGFSINLTEREAMAAELRTQQRQMAAILDHAPIAMFLKDREGRYQLVNRCFEDWYGVRAEDIYGKTAAAYLPPQSVADIRAHDELVVSRGEIRQFDRRITTARHGIEHVMVAKFPIYDDGRITGLAGFNIDVTDRMRTELALRESEERFRAIIENASDLICIVGSDGRLLYVSPSVVAGAGTASEEMVGSSFLEMVHPDDVPGVREVLSSLAVAEPGRRATGELRSRNKHGEWRDISWAATNALEVPGIGGICVIGRDITEEKRLGRQLQQAQRLDAIGRLASGIAHDFNNLLAAILGFAQFLTEDLRAGSNEHGFAMRIHKAGERGQALVRELLAFARQADVERRPENLAGLINDAAELIGAALPRSTALTVDLGDAGLTARVNATQITQVLMNLCLNGNDALNGEPGSISVTLERCVGERTPAAEADGCLVTGTLAPERAYACISVADTGHGMTPEVLRQVFEPFFTTKTRGRGTGLGLAVVHGIVTGAGGACRVVSRPGAGTTVTLYLPLVAALPHDVDVAPRDLELRGSERVLIVDDDGEVADVLGLGLDRLGYDVTVCTDPLEAAEFFDAAPGDWDVVITDQVMPAMKGLGLLRLLLARKPTLTAILCTGFGDDDTAAEAARMGIAPPLLKPVSPTLVARVIRERRAAIRG